MTSNAIKLIACISMLIDHAGVILFPEYPFLRWIGRLAMPLFAFTVAEGLCIRPTVNAIFCACSCSAFSARVPMPPSRF